MVVDEDGGLTYTPTKEAQIDVLLSPVPLELSDQFVITVSDGNGGTDVATVTVEVAPYAGPEASGLLQINEIARAQSARVDELEAQIKAVTAEIDELREQDPPNNALITEKIIEQQRLLQQYSNAVEIFTNTLFRLARLREQIIANT